jgi:hypothetical protein
MDPFLGFQAKQRLPVNTQTPTNQHNPIDYLRPNAYGFLGYQQQQHFLTLSEDLDNLALQTTQIKKVQKSMMRLHKTGSALVMLAESSRRFIMPMNQPSWLQAR